MSATTDQLTVLCAGDAFIAAETLGEAARRHLGDIEVRLHQSRWPDEPFGAAAGVKEAAGEVSEIIDAVADCDVVLTHLAPITSDVLDAAGSLRLIGSVRGGPVNVDVEAATSRGIPVAYLPGRNLQAVAEYTVGMVIALTRNIGAAIPAMAAGEYDASWFRFERCGPELGSATVGLVGFGAVGRRVAELLVPFGSMVLAYDPYADDEHASERGVKLVELADLLGRSDIVSLHARVTPENRQMCDEEWFASMRPGSYFINTARGELVDQGALRTALDSGHLAGAALDVFDPEPPEAKDPLRQPPKVLGTPHLGGASREVALRSADRAAQAAAEFFATGAIAHCANPQTLEGK